jgi:hypothetical protein
VPLNHQRKREHHAGQHFECDADADDSGHRTCEASRVPKKWRSFLTMASATSARTEP